MLVVCDQIKLEYFKNWVEWVKVNWLGLDFNFICFFYLLSVDGFIFFYLDVKICQFWIDYCKVSCCVLVYFGEQFGMLLVMNIWILDGMKDIIVDCLVLCQCLLEVLDEVISEKFDLVYYIDVVESKLFGIGVESYIVGFNEFYMGYVISCQIVLCLDVGYFYFIEVIFDKIFVVMFYVLWLLLYVSCLVCWDSDYVVFLDDEIQVIVSEIVCYNLFDCVYIGLDFFDVFINCVVVWVIGICNMKKVLLCVLLEFID